MKPESDALLNEPAGLLPSCPYCLYALHGLPIEHRCPECGATVDRRWTVVGGLIGAQSWQSKQFRYAPLILVIWPAMYLAFLFNIVPARAPPMLLTYGILLAVTGLIAFSVLWRPRRFLSVSPDGLRVHLDRKRVEHFEWPRVGRARHVAGSKRVEIQIDGLTRRFSLLGYFGNMFEADRAARVINNYARPKDS